MVPQSLGSLAQDIGFAARDLRRRPVFAAIAVASLALGLGATTAVFTLADVALLRPLPYRDAERPSRTGSARAAGRAGPTWWGCRRRGSTRCSCPSCGSSAWRSGRCCSSSAPTSRGCCWRARGRGSALGARLALGATPWRVARQMLTESVLLAALGVVPGLALAYGGASAFARLWPQLPPAFALTQGGNALAGSLAPDARVVLFAAATSALAGLLFGTAPALVAVGMRADVLFASGRSRTDGAKDGSGRRGLVVAQIALATMLLVGAGLTGRSLRALLRTDLGFDPAGVVVIRVASPDTSSAADVARRAALARVAELPGVDAVATHGCEPLDTECLWTMPLVAEGAAPVDAERAPHAELHVVSRDYFRAMRNPLLAGRAFGPRDESGESDGVMLGESAARALWPNEPNARSAVGRRVLARGPEAPASEVIGVARDAPFSSIEQSARPVVYLPARPARGAPQYQATLLVRTRARPRGGRGDDRWRSARRRRGSCGTCCATARR